MYSGKKEVNRRETGENKRCLSFRFYRPHSKDDGRLYFHFVCQSTPRRGRGGSQVQVQVERGGVSNPAMDGGGGPGLRFSGGEGPRSQIFWGGGL